jgi:DNA polymerase III delta prime subunit
MNNDGVRSMLESLLELSIVELTEIIKSSEDDRTRVAAIAQARALLKDSAIDVVINKDDEEVKKLGEIVDLKSLPFEKKA